MFAERMVLSLGPSEQSPGLMFVALSRARRLQDIGFLPTDFPTHRRYTAPFRSTKKQARLDEEARLHALCVATLLDWGEV